MFKSNIIIAVILAVSVSGITQAQSTTDERELFVYDETLESRVNRLETQLATLQGDYDRLSKRIFRLRDCIFEDALYNPRHPSADANGCVPNFRGVYPKDTLHSTVVDTAVRNGHSVNIDFSMLTTPGKPTHLKVDSICIALGSDAISRVILTLTDSDNRNTLYDTCLIAGVSNGESTQYRTSQIIPLTEDFVRMNLYAVYTNSASSASNNTRARTAISVMGTAEP